MIRSNFMEYQIRWYTKPLSVSSPRSQRLKDRHDTSIDSVVWGIMVWGCGIWMKTHLRMWDWGRFVDQEMIMKIRGSYLQVSDVNCVLYQVVLRSRFNLRSESWHSILGISVLVTVPTRNKFGRWFMHFDNYDWPVSVSLFGLGKILMIHTWGISIRHGPTRKTQSKILASIHLFIGRALSGL